MSRALPGEKMFIFPDRLKMFGKTFYDDIIDHSTVIL